MKIGLCGWTIRMDEYFDRYPLVEVQQTFYEPPAKRTLLRWRESAPPGFEFTLKAWQLITHRTTSTTYRRLKTPLTDDERAQVGAFQWSEVVQRAWQTTAECAAILGATMILFQCPASFKATPENIANMRTFFGRVERHGLRFLWEPRGNGWPPETIEGLCRELDLVHVVDPFVHRTVTPEFVYFRLHGITGARHRYTDAELHALAAMLPPRNVPAYVLFNEMPRDEDARRFMKIVSGSGA